MKSKTLILLIGVFFLNACQPHDKESLKDMKYSSAITFLYYEDFAYGQSFIENVLELNLTMDQEFARVYEVNQKAFLGIVRKRDDSGVSGSTLFSLTTGNVESEYERVRKLEVYNMTDIKHFESIPLVSFFFDDAEGHKFEIQQFLDEEDVLKF